MKSVADWPVHSAGRRSRAYLFLRHWRRSHTKECEAQLMGPLPFANGPGAKAASFDLRLRHSDVGWAVVQEMGLSMSFFSDAPPSPARSTYRTF